ncbi:MAG: hypothetical protein JOZ69_21450 [Myxococcales bacterium]|nr:hypothetical protein [Myxococcales bacterium]
MVEPGERHPGEEIDREELHHVRADLGDGDLRARVLGRAAQGGERAVELRRGAGDRRRPEPEGSVDPRRARGGERFEGALGAGQRRIGEEPEGLVDDPAEQKGPERVVLRA